MARVVTGAVAVVEHGGIGAHERRAPGVELHPQRSPAGDGIRRRVPLRVDAEVAAELELERPRAAVDVDRRKRGAGDPHAQVQRPGEPEQRSLGQWLGRVGQAMVLEQVAQGAAGGVLGHAMAKTGHNGGGDAHR